MAGGPCQLGENLETPGLLARLRRALYCKWRDNDEVRGSGGRDGSNFRLTWTVMKA